MSEKLSYKVKPITHLYWGKYPYKVTLFVPVPGLKKEMPWHHRTEAIHRAIRESVVGTDGLKCRMEAQTPSYFFTDPDAAEDFIAANLGLVKRFFRPESDEQIEMLSGDAKKRARKSLFFGRFRWCVVMRPNYRTDGNEECDEWIEDYFGLEPVKLPSKDPMGVRKYAENDRALYNYYWSRTVYVNDLADVCAIKLSLSNHVHQTLCAVLPGETED